MNSRKSIGNEADATKTGKLLGGKLGEKKKPLAKEEFPVRILN